MKEVIAFFLNGIEYGIEMDGLKSLEKYREVEVVDEETTFIEGWVVIRDDKIPVYDIRKKFNLPKTVVTEDTRILLLRTKEHGTIAFVIDAVGKVFKSDGDDVQPFPRIVKSEETSFVDFVVRRGDVLVVILDPNEFLTEEDIKYVDKLRKEEEEKKARQREEQRRKEEERIKQAKEEAKKKEQEMMQDLPGDSDKSTK
ncbi:MAG: chemotaxis protein CheW [Eubacterium sp.]|nr:chemotaxis protein CheW [Eubacterium sp.]